MTACPRCLLQQRVCLCAEVPTVATRTRVVIVRHHLEAYRSSNTGRLAQLALPNSQIVDYGKSEAVAADGAPRQEVRAVLPPLAGAWLLWPEGEPVRGPVADPPGVLVVLDATWSQARRMYRKLDALRGLPVLRLPDAPMPAARLRASPGPGQVSTIEAIARALRVLEGDAAAEPLERLFALAVERAHATGRLHR